LETKRGGPRARGTLSLSLSLLSLSLLSTSLSLATSSSRTWRFLTRCAYRLS
jgi:hypothetical protein